MKFGALDVRNVKMGGVNALKVLVGGRLAWVPTLRIQTTSNGVARDMLRSRLSSLGMDYTTTTEIPFEIDVTDSTILTDMFIGMSALSTTPVIHGTGGATHTNGMFRGCRSLEVSPFIDMSNVINAAFMYDDCPALRLVPTTPTPKLVTVSAMFGGTTSLTDGNVKLLGRDPFYTGSMINGSGMTMEPWYTRDGSARSHTYETDFLYGQTATVDLDGYDQWMRSAWTSRPLRIEKEGNVVPSTTTTDGTYNQASRRIPLLNGDYQAVSVRWSEPWEPDESGVFFGGSDAERVQFFASSSNPRFFCYDRNIAYLGEAPPVGTWFTITKTPVSSTTAEYKVYVGGSLQQTVTTIDKQGSAYRQYGVWNQHRRASWTNYFGPRINGFKAYDI